MMIIVAEQHPCDRDIIIPNSYGGGGYNYPTSNSVRPRGVLQPL